MLPFGNNIILLWSLPVFVLGAFYFFTDTPAIRNFTAVNGVINYHSDKMRTPPRESTVITFYLLDTLQIQIVGDFIKSHITIYIFVKDNAYCLSLFLLDKELFVFEVVAIGGKPAVPTTLTGFFLSPVHCLFYDIFTLYFSNGRQHRY